MVRVFGVFLLFVNCIVIYSCNKRNDEIAEIPTEQKRISEKLDSIFLLAQGVYLWNEQLPAIDRFNPLRFFNSDLSEFQCYENELFNLTQYAKNKETGELYERNLLDLNKPKYSNIVFREYQEKVQQNGYNVTNTFGLSVVIKNNILRLLYVDLNSPAGKAGLKRGDQILSMNGENVSSEASFLDQWKKSLSMSFIKLEIKDEIKKREVRLNAASYEINPVVKRNIIRYGDRKFGYFALNSFTPIQNAQKYLTPVFLSFAQENVKELILDLRYNRGGYQVTADFIANQVVSNNADGKVMYSEHYNSLMQEGNAKILEKYKLYDDYNVPIVMDGKEISLFDIDYSVQANTTFFNKKEGLSDVKKIYFIVSNRTASASELLINILKPYMDVQVLGVSDDNFSPVYTYGKPVGSFGIPIGQFDIFLGMYELKNANGDSDYFRGIKADFSFADNISADFASIDDPVIGWILNGGNGKTLRADNRQVADDISKNKSSYYLNDDQLSGNIKSKVELKSKIKR